MKKESNSIDYVLVSMFVIFFVGQLSLKVYMASVQAEVYRREGIEMSTWGVFVGAQPAERTINVK